MDSALNGASSDDGRLAKLGIRGLAPKLVEQPHPLATHPRDFLHQVNRQADGFA
ncbi:MAG: hypothetical protein MKZ92_03635 [Pedosphaera sp.]|nr:hypothetical protein [Pedosphaera sp.]